ncbi:MAG: SDR family oxidoreductase [Burkholderiales bacterium]|nr:SDR family oxidoreductase [Burkholderiales bacterium]MCW5603467.1 SDR family oxidoreductase [Burkholderiales bacterium]
MRILILGGDGMLGHRLLRHFGACHEVRATLRGPLERYAGFGLFHAGNAEGGVDVQDFGTVRRVFAAFRPEAVINATGIVKQRAEAAEAIPSIEINALFPHRMAALCAETGARFVHMSTDCVFSGKRGGYREDDAPDAEDLYGRSKRLGEVAAAPAITLRTSIIGRELSRKTGLLEWFLAQQGAIRGYRRAIFSGFTTIEMTHIIEMLLTRFPQAHGLYHVSSAAISKHELLALIRDRLGLQTRIDPDDEFHCDRSLDSTRFRRAFGYEPPSWPAMIDELVTTTG